MARKKTLQIPVFKDSGDREVIRVITVAGTVSELAKLSLLLASGVATSSGPEKQAQTVGEFKRNHRELFLVND